MFTRWMPSLYISLCVLHVKVKDADITVTLFVNITHLHVAPQVQFEHSSYALEPPLTSVLVCIVSTIPEEGAPGFSVSVSVTSGTGIHV